MTTTRVETLPTRWDDASDVPFFRITERLFTPDFCSGASVLLASYDDSLGELDSPVAERRTVVATSAGTRTRTQTDHGPVPARVRRPR
jgi:hypothetical protein